VKRRLTNLLIILAGIVFGQVVLYGPSLIGKKILLPLDVLSYPGFYLPNSPGVSQPQIQNIYLQDLVCVFEPARRFAVSEVHAGRFPMWLPYEYAGSPFIEPKFSPFLAPQLCIASPVVLAWTQVLAALVAGLGAYFFFRSALGVGFWPATLAAWCYPLTAFFIFWQGYPTGNSVYWLPWLFLAISKTVRNASGWEPLALGLVTCLVLISGHLDVAAQVLLAGGLYALWCLFDAFPRDWFKRQAGRAALKLVAAWTLGFLLAAPHLLPLLEYTRTGARFERRSVGEEERPPVGLAALPQVVLPDMYGAYGPDKTDSFRIVPDNQVESTAAAYAGVVATLLLTPVAFCNRRHRALCCFLVGMTFLSLSWCLKIPGIVTVLRLPGLNLMSHSRLVFIACFGILTMAAIGLDALSESIRLWRSWMWFPVVLLAGLLLWCIYRAARPPEPVANQLEQAVMQGKSMGWVHSLDAVRRVQTWFMHRYAIAGLLCGLGLAGWAAVRFRPQWQAGSVPILGLVMLADLLWFDYGRNVQSDPSLYFPPIPVLEQVARSAPGRVAGYYCMPATLAGACGLSDLRGYDGVDPARIVDLLQIAAGPPTSTPKYALTQYIVPEVTLTAYGSVHLPPVLDMLGVRYVIFRGSPAPGSHPVFQGADYWALVNSNALDRVFVPQRVEFVPDKTTRLSRLSSDQFNPREVAFVESALSLPTACEGEAQILDEIPTQITIAARMETPGLLVLADRWDVGWRAFLNGTASPILRVNHAVRGVVIPPGESVVQFRYEPASFAQGLRLSTIAAALMLGWVGLTAKNRIGQRTSQNSRSPTSSATPTSHQNQ
jgi:hypothetical protein